MPAQAYPAPVACGRRAVQGDGITSKGGARHARWVLRLTACTTTQAPRRESEQMTHDDSR
jgi:hypothetical protein